MTTMQTTIASPVGPLALTVDDDGALTRLGFGPGATSDDPRFAPAVAQLREYFAGERTAFDLYIHTGQRGSDIVQLGWHSYRNGGATLYIPKQEKTGKPAFIPVSAALK